jgi:hypothetical protein
VFREAAFGVAELTVVNATHAYFEWSRAACEDAAAADRVDLSETCRSVANGPWSFGKEDKSSRYEPSDVAWIERRAERSPARAGCAPSQPGQWHASNARAPNSVAPALAGELDSSRPLAAAVSAMSTSAPAQFAKGAAAPSDGWNGDGGSAHSWTMAATGAALLAVVLAVGFDARVLRARCALVVDRLRIWHRHAGTQPLAAARQSTEEVLGPDGFECQYHRAF